MSTGRNGNPRLREEPPPPPLEPQQASDRALFIRDNIRIVERLRDEGKTFDEMKEATPDFANNFPHLFILVSSKDGYNKETLKTMLTMIDKMASSQISQHDASVKVGEHLMRNYAKPS
jgi:hypothetical protein